ncbi:hypothetical protein [Microvirga sp. 2TAF3]|uniref:hypothetical protein n=1 Tax=Microvirga sp. 2TAF3 TaxID=3233014 RepID=UPI003F9EA3F6
MHRPRSALTGLFIGTGLAAMSLAGPAFAQTPPNPSALTLTVRPSGYDAQSENQARQERLMKRLEQADYSVRSICTHCGDSWKHQTYAPFNPIQALRSPHPTDDQ